jgi:alanyl-tRNA synthetase
VDAVDLMKKTSEKAGIQIRCGGRNDFAQAGGILTQNVENLIKILKAAAKSL